MTDEVLQPTETQAPVPQEAAVQSFYDSLPEHLKANKGLSKFDSVEKLADAYVNASKLIGKRVTELTPVDIKGLLDPEDLAAVFRSNGVPASADEYQVAAGIPEDLARSLKSRAHELGVSQEALNGLIEFETSMAEAVKAQRQEEWRSETFSKFGRDLDPTLKIAKRAVEEFGGDSLRSFLNETGLGDHPAVIETFFKVGQTMREDVPVEAPKAVSQGSDRDRLAALMKDPDFIRQWREGRPEAAAKINALYEQ